MKNRAHSGFGLVEVLIAVLILAIGFLGVAKLQTTTLANSAENKSRYEALAIASSRLEELRNYSGTVTNAAEFATAYGATAGYVNDTAIAGKIADYTRREKITQNGTTMALAVQVGWTDETGAAREVELDTGITWQNPRLASDFLTTQGSPLVDSPTGRAHLGDGVLPDNSIKQKNGDGTDIADLGNGDLGLISGDSIVLTLEDACVSGNCIDFVKISGRVYIDTATQANLKPGEVFVQASNAAFCQRFYIDGSGDPVEVDDDTTTVPLTASGDYAYFDYRCYLGGGWHGNIGILLADGVSQNDKVCMGDPVSVNPWEQPVISLRRSYRGMLYRHDGAGGRVTFVDAYGVTRTRYYSEGVADAAELPAAGDGGHDFVISKMSVGSTTGDNCTSQGIMIRPDSVVGGVPGRLFADVPGDFVCFNEESILDAYDTAIFGHDAFCPFDPTDPPVTAHQITGQVVVTAADDDYLDTIGVNTSDGPGNCSIGGFSPSGADYVADYACAIYDWGTGWDGFVQVKGDESKIICSPDRNHYASINTSQALQDFGCIVGNRVVVIGSVTTPNANADLTSAAISDLGGTCQVASDGESYVCLSEIFFSTTWSGSVQFTTNKVFCPTAGFDETSGVATFGNLEPGYYELNLTVANNAGSCP